MTHQFNMSIHHVNDLDFLLEGTYLSAELGINWNCYTFLEFRNTVARIITFCVHYIYEKNWIRSKENRQHFSNISIEKSHLTCFMTITVVRLIGT